MTPESLIEAFEAEFERRKFVAGLLVALIDFLVELDAVGGSFQDFEALTRTHPQQVRTKAGKTANTLILEVGGKNRSLRPYYNKAETAFRVEHERFDYPNAAPHATQAWSDYRHWIEALMRFTPLEAAAVRSHVIAHVLEKLPSHAVCVSELEPLKRPFSDLLAGFETAAQKGEKQGAVYQGMVFAYIRADAPHLFLEVSKVGAGSKRLQRVGDIDGWQGERLTISAEVKSFHIDRAQAETLLPFVRTVQERRALPSIAAHSFSDDARSFLAELGARILDLPRLESLVDLWDPLKQQAALDAFTYYVHHVEKSGPLIERLRSFLRG